MSTNGWGKGSINNTNGWGAGAINNDIGWGDSQLKSWSGDTDIDGGTGIPVNTVAPVISGTTTLGSVLTTTNGTWTAKPTATFTYQWKRNGSNIIGATNSTYTLVNDDGATNITCEVTATNDFGSASATSNTLAIPAFTDADAQAFITAAAITNPTQQSAINQLVTDLKGYGIWTKMKALYPFVGGTASQHKWNLKDPRDLDAAFRLVFNGGWTHSSTGATPNGTNAFANTYFSPNPNQTKNNAHLSYYSRTNAVTSSLEIGVNNGGGFARNMTGYNFGGIAYTAINANITSRAAVSNPTTGFLIGSRTTQLQEKYYSSTGLETVNNDSAAAAAISTFSMYLGAVNNSNSGQFYSNKQCAFASIGDGLTDTEAANFYTAVQTFQVTLGRSIGTQTVSDADAQAFVTNAGIVDQVEANAVNNLVIGLKADGLWSKMKAVYPFVGGTATSNSYNLKNTAQYQITWFGGLTHNANGVTGSGTNGYGDTFLNNNVLAQNDNHLSVYIRTSGGNTGNDLASWNGSTFGISMYTNFLGGFTSANNAGGTYFTFTQANQGGLYINRRISSTQFVQQRNLLKQTNNNNSSNHIATSFKLLRTGDFNGEYSNKNLAFASLGDGLNNTEADALVNRVQAFQTTLNRQV